MGILCPLILRDCCLKRDRVLRTCSRRGRGELAPGRPHGRQNCSPGHTLRGLTRRCGPVFSKVLVAASRRTLIPQGKRVGAGTLCPWLWRVATSRHSVLVRMRSTFLKLPFLLKLTRNFWSRTKLGIFVGHVPDGVGGPAKSAPPSSALCT